MYTVPGFDAPAMFPSNGVMTWRPLLSTGSLGMVPPLQRYYGTLRLPAVYLDPFDFFTSRYYPGKKDHHKRVTTERPHPTGGGCPPARTRKGEVDSDSLFRVFRWIPWLISDPPGASIGCCWTESAVRICADLGCRGNNDVIQLILAYGTLCPSFSCISWFPFSFRGFLFHFVVLPIPNWSPTKTG